MLPLFISTSARKAHVIPVWEFSWYRFEGKQAVSVENKDYEADVENKDVFGIKNISVNKFILAHREDPEVYFDIDAKTCRSLLGRSRPFTGKVGGIKVTSSPRATKVKTDTPTDVSQANKIKRWTAVRGSKPEDKKITRKLQSMPIDGASGLTFLASVPFPTGEIYTYYEATSTFSSYKTTQRAKWEKALEDAAIKQCANLGLVIGATFLKFKDGSVHPTLVIAKE